MGHYAMPMLWREQMLGWANLKVVDGRLQHALGFAGPRPRGPAFTLALDEALHRMQTFLDSKLACAARLPDFNQRRVMLNRQSGPPSEHRPSAVVAESVSTISPKSPSVHAMLSIDTAGAPVLLT